jgi:general secretion pathway protein F
VLARFQLQQEAARIARTLGTLLRAGVPLLRAATSACDVVGNRHVAAGIARAIGLLQEGASLHHALAAETTLPAVALRMISVGEEAGKLDRMLLAVAVKFEQQTQRSIDRFMTTLTPLLTMTIAVLVGGLIMAVMNAILSVNELAAR